MGAYHFEEKGGGEQNYGEIEGCCFNEMKGIIKQAAKDGVNLVAIMDAECDVVMITTVKIAELLLPLLNSERLQPLDALNYTDGKVPDDVVELRKLRYRED